MEKVKLDYVGKLTIKSVRDFILDNKLTDRDTIILNSKNFDDVVLEYRETYKESLQNPYIVLGCVLVEEDQTDRVPIDRVGLIKDDPRRPFQIRNKDDYKKSLMNSEEIIYRCGMCGNIVDEKGEELDSKTYHRLREILTVREGQGFTKHVYGQCCIDQIQSFNANKDGEKTNSNPTSQ